MKNTLYSYIQKFKSDHRRFRHWTALLLALAVVVVTGVFWRLHDIGIAFTGESVDGTEAVYEGTELETLAEEVSETDYNSEETDADGNSLTEDETALQNTEEQNTQESNTEDQNSEETNTEELNTEGANILELANTESGTEEQENANSLTTGSAAEEYLAAIALLAEQADKLTGTESEDAWTIYNALLTILDEAEADLAAGNLTETEYDAIYDALDEAIAGMEALGFDFSQIMTVANDITIEVEESTGVIGQNGGYSSYTLKDSAGNDATSSFTIEYVYAPSTTISSGTSYYVMNYLTSGITGAYFLMNETSSSGMKLNYDSDAVWSDSNSYLVTSYAPSSLSQWTFNSSSGKYKMKSGNNYLQQNNTTGIKTTTRNNDATEFSVESVSGTSAFYIYVKTDGRDSKTYALNHYGGEEVAALWESSSAAENEQWYLLSNYGLQLTGLYPGTYTLTMNWTNGGSTTYTITVSGSKSSKVVLNLGNGNGTSSNGDYVNGTGQSGTDALRYTVSISNEFADTDGNVTINLPSDSDLAATTGTTKNFTVVDADASKGLSAVTVDLGKEQNYDYKLVGWVNIATGEYYDVSGGSVTATVDTTKNNVFYADWVADESTLDYTNIEGLGVDTSAFVKINMFDYNELFNLYSASLSQTGTTSEAWSDSGSFYEDPIVALVANGIYSTATALEHSFAFQNMKTNSQGGLGYLYDLETWNNNVDSYNSTAAWTDINTASTSAIIQALYDTSGSKMGVHYLGSSNYLFQIDSSTGYYYFDADKNGASYNQEEQRFYLSDNKTTLQDGVGGYSYGTGFMPLNDVGSYTSISDGNLNYWFGMSVEIEFYLPNTVGTSGGNQWNGYDMMFQFSGDDDVWVFIDDELVLDLGGIHSDIEGTIDFSTGDVTADYSSSNGVSSSISGLGAGTHTLTVYYMERGAWDSNMKMTFNMASLWDYETTLVGTMEVTKEWSDGESAHTNDSVTVGLYKRVEITKSEDNGDGTVTYYYDNSITNNGTNNFTFEYDQYSVYLGAESLYMKPDVGSVDAYIADEDWNNGSPKYMYVLIDIQELNESTYNGYSDNRRENWSYAWGQLDYDSTYAIRELTGKGGYTSSITSTETIKTYQYWGIAGSAELNGTITTTTGNTGYTHDGALKDGLKILITDAALYGTETDTLPVRYVGYSLVYTKSGDIDIKETYFSSAAAALDASNAYYSYGVTSDDNNNIPSNAYWYVKMTGEYRDTVIYVKNGNSTVSMTVTVPTFYLMTAESGGKYLAVTSDGNGGYTLTLVDDINAASAFAYNGNGELETLITTNGNTQTTEGLKIVINHTTKTVGGTTVVTASWGVKLRSGETDENNVKIYIEQDIETTGYSYTITNSPTLSLVKVSSEDDGNGNYTALSGAVFALYKLVEEDDPNNPNSTITTKYYYSVTPEGIVIWSTKQATLTTDSSGYITLTGIDDGTWYLEEISAPDGYNAIAGTIEMVVENGVIASTTLLDSNGSTITGSDSVVSILQLDTADTSDDLTLLVKDTPGVELPSAGGFGKAPYAVFGLLICGSAVLLLYRRRRIAR